MNVHISKCPVIDYFSALFTTFISIPKFGSIKLGSPNLKLNTKPTKKFLKNFLSIMKISGS